MCLVGRYTPLNQSINQSLEHDSEKNCFNRKYVSVSHHAACPNINFASLVKDTTGFMLLNTMPCNTNFRSSVPLHKILCAMHQINVQPIHAHLLPVREQQDGLDYM